MNSAVHSAETVTSAVVVIIVVKKAEEAVMMNIIVRYVVPVMMAVISAKIVICAWIAPWKMARIAENVGNAVLILSVIYAEFVPVVR